MSNTWQNDYHRRSSQFAAVGILLFIVTLFGFLTFGLTQPKNLLHAFATVPRPGFIRALDPIEAVQGGIPFERSIPNHYPTPSQSVRAIEVSVNRVQVVQGGTVLRSIAIAAPTLSAVVHAVGRSAWISEPSPGNYRLSVALVFERGVHVDLAPPLVRRIDLTDVGDTMIGFYFANAKMDDILVTSPGAKRARPLAPRFRPYVESWGSTLVVSNSTFDDLGWDWNSSYGFSFMTGSTGEVTNSTFEDSFIGVYTYRAHHITFIGNHFLHNNLYGLDPHTYSSALTIKGNVAKFNAAHGIIFSQHVTQSTVESNISEHNGENGIMMDASSVGNVLRGNVAEYNHGDGIVLSSSSDNAILGNTLRDNRTGINVYGTMDGGPDVQGNVISHNVVATQGFSLDAGDNVISNNVSEGSAPPPAWHVFIDYLLWPLTGALFAAAGFLRVLERRRLPRRTPRPA